MFRRRRLFFRISRIIVMFVVGLAVALLIALSQVNLETLRADILAVLRTSTGFQVEIDGDISWKFSLRPKVELNNVRVPNEEWAKNKDGFKAEKIDVTLNLLSLLQDKPTIQNVRIHNSVVRLEKNDSGKYSIHQQEGIKKEETTQNGKRAKYPFEDPGLGAVEVRNLVAHIDGEKYSLTGFNLSYSANKQSREYSGWIKPDNKVFPFIISLSEYNEERKIYPVRIALSTGGEALVANVALEGTSLMPIDFIVKGNIPDIASLGKMFNLDLPQTSMVKLNLVGGFEHNKLNFRQSSIAVKNSKINFSGGISWASKVPSITLKMNTKKFDLMEVYPGLYTSGSKWIRPNRDLHVFKGIPLHGDLFHKYNITLDAKADHLILYRDLSVKNMDMQAKLKDADLRVDLKSGFADGDISAALEATANTDGRLSVRAAGMGERVYAGEIFKAIHEPDYISELPLNFEFYLEGHGSDLTELVSNTTGPVYLYSVGHGYAHSELVVYMYGTDFLTTLRHNVEDLFRSKKKNDQIKISCAAMNVKIRDGRIDTENGVAVETNAINVRLTGKVNFGAETLKLSLITVPVRGLKLSLTGNVVNAIEISGNLAEPDVKISGSAVAGKVASATGIGMLLAPLTGGLSLVAGAGVGLLAGDLLENWLADDHPCRTAMKSGAPEKKGDPEWLNKPMAELVSELIK